MCALNPLFILKQGEKMWHRQFHTFRFFLPFDPEEKTAFFLSIRAQAKLQNYLRKMGVTLIFSYLQSGRRLSGWTMLGNCNSRELILLSVLTLAAASSNSSTFACKATVEGNLPVKLVGFLNSKIRNIVLP